MVLGLANSWETSGNELRKSAHNVEIRGRIWKNGPFMSNDDLDLTLPYLALHTLHYIHYIHTHTHTYIYGTIGADPPAFSQLCHGLWTLFSVGGCPWASHLWRKSRHSANKKEGSGRGARWMGEETYGEIGCHFCGGKIHLYQLFSNRRVIAPAAAAKTWMTEFA